jgi:aminoglycoside 3-N-acetyltransferase
MEDPKTDVRRGIRELGLGATPVCIHVSLRSFGLPRVRPSDVTEALLEEGCTILIPTMVSDYTIPPPEDDRPARNAFDYERLGERPWPGLDRIFTPDSTDVAEWLGATSTSVASHPHRLRSSPEGTFCALGPLASRLMLESSSDVYGPLRALCGVRGSVLLMGVGLTRMTLLHFAEVMAGRRPFIRWINGPDGKPMRVAGGECSEGFEHLSEALSPHEQRVVVRESLWRAFPAAEAAEVAAAAIRRDPEVTRCSRDGCQDCVDAIAGGPIDSRPKP